jgi:hypothetical protein
VYLTGVADFRRLVDAEGFSPSTGAKAAKYAILQADPTTCIYDGRTAPNVDLETVAPPIHMYHRIFSRFHELLNEAPSQITEEFLLRTQDFMAKASVVCAAEEDRRLITWECLNELLDLSLSTERNPDGSLPDGVYAVPVRGIRSCLVIIEIKREMGEGGSDPTNQVAISFKKVWVSGDVSLALHRLQS